MAAASARPSSSRQDRPSPVATSAVPAKPVLLNGFRAAAGLLSLLVLIQAFMAGRSENLGYGDWSIVPHGILGNISFIFGVAALVLAIVARAPKSVLAVAAVIVVLMVAQIGLGYVAGDEREAGAWHIPNGVVIFALTVYQVSLARRLAKQSPVGA